LPSASPSDEKFTVRKELTSDSTLPEEEDMLPKERIIRIPICKVCKQPFGETQEKVICDNCKHYCHVEHSSRYELKTYDHLCLVDMIGVDKRSYKVLYGLIKGYSRNAIRKAARLSSEELRLAITDLKQHALVRQKILGLELTYKTQEILPVLDSIYGNEADVNAFTSELAGHSAIGFSLPFIGISSSRIMFAIIAVGIVAIMLVVDSSVLAFMRVMMFPSAVIVIVWILILLATAYLIYLVWKLFS
jgi:hypothetical protein